MEKHLEKSLEEILASEGVTGCLVSDKHGLCLGAKGKCSPESSGRICAIAEQARKLDKTGYNPVILLEGEYKQCLIQKNNDIVTAVFKTI